MGFSAAVYLHLKKNEKEYDNKFFNVLGNGRPGCSMEFRVKD